MKSRPLLIHIVSNLFEMSLLPHCNYPGWSGYDPSPSQAESPEEISSELLHFVHCVGPLSFTDIT